MYTVQNWSMAVCKSYYYKMTSFGLFGIPEPGGLIVQVAVHNCCAVHNGFELKNTVSLESRTTEHLYTTI